MMSVSLRGGGAGGLPIVDNPGDLKGRDDCKYAVEEEEDERVRGWFDVHLV
jgi:hypothetical protein